MGRIIRTFLLVSTLYLLGCRDKMEVDCLYFNGTVYLLDSAFSQTQALAVTEGRIVDAGDLRTLLIRYRFKDSVDLKGGFLYPGFIDAHCHFVGYGKSLGEVDLRGTRSWDEVVGRLMPYRNNPSDTSWLIGRGWDQNDWAIEEFPDRTLLDSLFPHRPVLLSRVDGHAVVVNERALRITQFEVIGQRFIGRTASKMAKEGRNGGVDWHNRDAAQGGSPHHSGGEALRRGDGSLSGVLIDNAADLIQARIPKPSVASWKNAILAAQKACHAVGLTSVHDAGLDEQQLEALRSLEQEKQLSMGVYAMVSATPDQLDRYLSRPPYRGLQLHIRSFKFFADGALGSRGARLLEPYHDREGHVGLWVTSPDTLAYYAPLLARAGYQMNTHCIGDAANRAVLQLYRTSLFDYAQSTGTKPSSARWRIEHAQVVHPDDRTVFRSVGVVPSVQPTHATSDMYWANERLGPERLPHAYAYRDLLSLNGWLPLGTDFPVEEISPLKTFLSAVFRTDSLGFPKGGFLPNQALTRRQALRGMTDWAARAAFEEDERGRLLPGMNADLVWLDTDLMSASYQEIFRARVLGTWSRGNRVYAATVR
jgi:predicted amidohydrolase YtcJ